MIGNGGTEREQLNNLIKKVRGLKYILSSNLTPVGTTGRIIVG